MIVITIKGKPNSGKTILASLIFSYLADLRVSKKEWKLSEDFIEGLETEFTYDNALEILDQQRQENNGTLNNFSILFKERGMSGLVKQVEAKCKLVIDVTDNATQGGCEASFIIAYLRERITQEGFTQVTGNASHSFSWFIVNFPHLLSESFISEVRDNSFLIQEEHIFEERK